MCGAGGRPRADGLRNALLRRVAASDQGLLPQRGRALAEQRGGERVGGPVLLLAEGMSVEITG